MKRDMDLIRNLLLKVEELPPGASGTQVHELGLGPKGNTRIVRHVQILLEDGLIEGRVSESERTAPYNAVIERLTSKGHDFLDVARDKSIWEKTKKRVGEVPLDVWFEALKLAVKQAVGLADN